MSCIKQRSGASESFGWKRKMQKPWHAAAAAGAMVVACAVTSQFTMAQSYPSRPIRFIVPFPPGGGLDITARLVAPRLSEYLGKPVVIDNRPGAGGAVGLDIASKATADGHTVVMASASHVIQALLARSGFDFFRDLAPVSEIIATPYLLVTYPRLPVKTVGELVAYAKAHPSKLNYASAGNGTLQQLAMELFIHSTGIQALHVPYKGFAPALTDVMAGRAHMLMSSLAALAPHIRAKTIHALAVTSAERSPVLPEVPTMAEAGVAGFVVDQWQGALAPAGTPPPIVERLHREIARALQQPEVASFLAKDGSQAIGSSPRQFRAKLEAERTKWAGAIRQAGLKPE